MDHADPQKEAVYDWEGEFLDWNRQTLTLPSVRSYVRTACAHYGLKAPSVHRHEGKAYAFSNGALVSFPDWCMNPAVALHEAAHYITDQLYGTSLQDHGKTWLGIYMWLLESAHIAPPEALRASARRYKLKWRVISPGQAPQREHLAIRIANALLHDGAKGRRFPRRPHGPIAETQQKRRGRRSRAAGG